ncbi:MAG: hypothetical protein KatS3mg105_0412 [Gemmatales bacterium]|nr:MAG: hypothetical protein KatS3mg105_0412 [Gemmatales bacterium]
MAVDFVDFETLSLKNAREMALALFEESGDALFLFDPESEIILNANPIAQRLSGFSYEELIGSRLPHFIRSDEHGGLSQLRRAYRTTGFFHSRSGFWLRQKRQGWTSVNVTVSRLHLESQTLALLVARDHSEYKREEESLRKARDELEEQIQQQTEELIRIKEALRSEKYTLEQVRSLSGHLQAVREQERTRIARELHDELGQALTGLKLDIVWIRNRLAKLGEPATILAEKAQAMANVIDNTIQTVRRITTELRPGVLDSLGLLPAIEWLVQDFEKRSGISCSLKAGEIPSAIDSERITALFRILQESLTNVARHAQASKVEVRIGKQGNSILLEVEDDGRGFQPEDIVKPAAFGLLGMRERAEMAGGTFDLLPLPKGTRAVACIPVR